MRPPCSSHCVGDAANRRGEVGVRLLEASSGAPQLLEQRVVSGFGFPSGLGLLESSPDIAHHLLERSSRLVIDGVGAGEFAVKLFESVVESLFRHRH